MLAQEMDYIVIRVLEVSSDPFEFHMGENAVSLPPSVFHFEKSH